MFYIMYFKLLYNKTSEPTFLAKSPDVFLSYLHVHVLGREKNPNIMLLGREKKPNIMFVLNNLIVL